MTASLLNISAVRFLRRITAMAAAALMLVLSASAVSPALHAELHDHGADEVSSPAHLCAVALFASGIVLGDSVGIEAAESRPIAIAHVLVSDPCVVAPHGLRPPPCGPPAC